MGNCKLSNNILSVVGSPTFSLVSIGVTSDSTNRKRAVLEKGVDHSSALFTGGADDCDNFLAHIVG